MIQEKLSKEQFTEEFNKLYQGERPIVIFGAGEIGKRAVLRMEYLGLKNNIACLGDNNPDKGGTCVEEIEILSKQEIRDRYPDARIVITVGNSCAAEVIRKELMELGFHDFISRQALLHRFEFDGHREKALVYRDGKYILRQIVVCVTERCTLRCKNCSQMMPRFTHPQDMDTSQVITSIQNLMDSITYVQDLTLLGGEPLMNKELPEICRAAGELKKQGKIKFISIVSNATIIPSKELLGVMKEYGIMITFSDYGELSVNMKGAQQACEEHGVEWRYSYSGGKNEEKIQYWSELSTERRDFTKVELDAKFTNCNSLYDCNMIYKGRYYFCSFAPFLAGLGIINPEGNSFDLLDTKLSKEERIQSYRAFMAEEKATEGCYYCDFHGRVPVAEQV